MSAQSKVINNAFPRCGSNREFYLTHLPADPVKVPVTLVALLVHEISEESPQVVVVGRLKEVQPPNVTQVLGKLLCKNTHTVTTGV